MRTSFLLWLTLLLAACAGFVLLGNWQVHRLAWKLALIHDVTTRAHATPVLTPGPSDWSRIQAGHLQYLHVYLEGHYLPGRQTLVHGASEKGYGYWVMTPLATERGFIVMVNRGHVSGGLPETPAFARADAPAGPVRITGLLRFSEPGGGFLRPNRPKASRWYSRDVAAIARSEGLAPDRVAPYFVDAGAGPAGSQPVSGLTRTHFYNHHLQYAITWYALALGSLLGAAIVIHQERRNPQDRS
ncbi:SURF1 family protein [Castellaniella sp.]|uniref:SURF1 family protein n=1 Tax=Castellaniella sp. TaxID=1955812 RepID=UPI0025B7F9F7|nr:SURF1 family protein [Castellaniella sp.]